MKVCWWDDEAIRAGDFAGIVPASRGAHCRPLHPRLASLCCPRRASVSAQEPSGELGRTAGTGAASRDRDLVGGPSPGGGRFARRGIRSDHLMYHILF